MKPLRDIRFPINRGSKSVKEKLEDLFEKYKNAIDQFEIISVDDKATIHYLCDGLMETLENYEKFNVHEAYCTFFRTMNRVEKNLYSIQLECEEGGTPASYYRVATNDKAGETTEKMLHIPLSNRQYASSNRFSFPGMPCSYMASKSELAWFECGLPEKYYIAKYQVSADELGKNNLLYLSINPLDVFRSIEIKIQNNGLDDGFKKYINNICKILPLLYACSFSVKNKNVKFIEEYIIPQMLMSWIPQSNRFIGVRFNSSNSYPAVNNSNAYNIAIPAKEFDSDGYCKNLQKIFNNDSAQKKHVEFNNQTKLVMGKYSDILELKVEVEHEFKTSRVVLPFKELIDICNLTLCCIENLEKNYENSAGLCFQMLTYLNTQSQIVVEELRKNPNDNKFSQKDKEKIERILVEFEKHVYEECLNKFNNCKFADLDFPNN